MALPVYENPSWLNDQDAATIHRRMMGVLPADLDKTQGGFPWDMTRPSALELAELLQFCFPEVLKLMQPAWAYGVWLDLHAAAVHLTRRPANAAAGKLRLTGTPGTDVPVGFRFAVPAAGEKAAVEYLTVEAVRLGEGGAADVKIAAVLPGVDGNAPAGAVTLMVTPLKGISAVTNSEPVTGGAEVEDDESLRLRIDEVNATAELSYVGCQSDYIRWAKEVPGVGSVVVLPAWDGPGTVKLIVVDKSGLPANDVMLGTVYDHIMMPDDPINRRAPIGLKKLTVCAPTPKKLRYAATLILQQGSTADVVVERFKAALQVYYDVAKQEGVLRYQRVGAELSAIPGVLDFRGLTINGATGNIDVGRDEYPETESVLADVGDAL